MSLAALMLVKDEDDIIEVTVRHLLTQTDELLIADNLSTDGTLEILEGLAEEFPEIVLTRDREIGYWQADKTTALARVAFERGHDWVLPCDADEIWHANDFRPINKWVGGLAPNVGKVTAFVYNHLCTTEDNPTARNPVERIRWRQREYGMRKVLCRNLPGLQIEMGNHDARTDTSLVAAGGLSVRHFSWRTPEQYLRKIRNGEKAYAATTLPAMYGVDWRRWADKPDDAIIDHFKTWFLIPDPGSRPDLIYDPAPVKRAS